jgi:hypothetical protein
MMGRWSKEGIDRFIVLHDMVKKDWRNEKRKDLEKNILEYQKEEELAAEANKKGKEIKVGV